MNLYIIKRSDGAYWGGLSFLSDKQKDARRFMYRSEAHAVRKRWCIGEWKVYRVRSTTECFRCQNPALIRTPQDVMVCEMCWKAECGA